MGAEPEEWLVIAREEKGSSVTVSLKGGSVHLKLYWAEGKGGGRVTHSFPAPPPGNAKHLGFGTRNLNSRDRPSTY